MSQRKMLDGEYGSTQGAVLAGQTTSARLAKKKKTMWWEFEQLGVNSANQTFNYTPSNATNPTPGGASELFIETTGFACGHSTSDAAENPCLQFLPHYQRLYACQANFGGNLATLEACGHVFEAQDTAWQLIPGDTMEQKLLNEAFINGVGSTVLGPFECIGSPGECWDALASGAGESYYEAGGGVGGVANAAIDLSAAGTIDDLGDTAQMCRRFIAFGDIGFGMACYGGVGQGAGIAFMTVSTTAVGSSMLEDLPGRASVGESTADAAGQSPPLVIEDGQFGAKVGTHARDFGLNPADPTARAQIRSMIAGIHRNFDELKQGPWNPKGGGGTDYLFYRQGADVVVTQSNGSFVTILKGGEMNGWFQGATRIG